GNSAARDGGGIYVYLLGTITVTNSTLSGNSASRDGGGIFAYFGATTLTNSTLKGDSAARDGGGIWANGSVSLLNTLVASSPAGGNCSGAIASLGHDLDSDGTCKLTATGDLPGTDPL